MTQLKGVISYPTPPYSNVSIEPQFYKPSRFVISNVSLGPTTIVTTSIDHNYVIGQQVRLIIPRSFGCYQLNESTGYVLSIPSTTEVEITIGSIVNVDQYIASSSQIESAQILAIGDLNMGIISSTGRVIPTTAIPGSFQNISPL